MPSCQAELIIKSQFNMTKYIILINLIIMFSLTRICYLILTIQFLDYYDGA